MVITTGILSGVLAAIAWYSMGLYVYVYRLFSKMMRGETRLRLVPSWLSGLTGIFGIAPLWLVFICLLVDPTSASLSDPVASIALTVLQSLIAVNLTVFALTSGWDRNFHLFGLTMSERMRLAVMAGLLMLAPWLIRAIVFGLHEPAADYAQCLAWLYLIDTAVFFIYARHAGMRSQAYSAFYLVRQPVSNGY